jgi:pyrrolidone-carboxylate peptidase
MMKGTNVANFYVNAGGFQCNHQIYGVATAVVPKELRQQFGVE